MGITDSTAPQCPALFGGIQCSRQLDHRGAHHILHGSVSSHEEVNKARIRKALHSADKALQQGDVSAYEFWLGDIEEALS